MQIQIVSKAVHNRDPRADLAQMVQIDLTNAKRWTLGAQVG